MRVYQTADNLAKIITIIVIITTLYISTKIPNYVTAKYLLKESMRGKCQQLVKTTADDKICRKKAVGISTKTDQEKIWWLPSTSTLDMFALE